MPVTCNLPVLLMPRRRSTPSFAPGAVETFVRCAAIGSTVSVVGGLTARSSKRAPQPSRSKRARLTVQGCDGSLEDAATRAERRAGGRRRGSRGRRGRSRERRKIDDALGVTRRSNVAVVRADLSDLYRVLGEVDVAAVNGEPAELEKVAARAPTPERNVSELDEGVAQADRRAAVNLLGEVVASDGEVALVDVEGHEVVRVGREARRLDALDLHLALGFERREAQRSLLREREVRGHAQADRFVSRDSGSVREAAHRNREIAHGRLERRLRGLVAEVDRRVLEREAIEREARARLLFMLGLLRAITLFVVLLLAFLLPRGQLLGARFLAALGARRGVVSPRLGLGRRGDHVLEVERPVALAPDVDLQARD